MNKKLLSVFFAVLLCVVVSVPAFADTAEDYTPHLIDNADLLTGEEESNLLAKLDEISDRLSVDVAVVTEDSIGDKTPREYADAPLQPFPRNHRPRPVKTLRSASVYNARQPNSRHSLSYFPEPDADCRDNWCLQRRHALADKVYPRF